MSHASGDGKLSAATKIVSSSTRVIDRFGAPAMPVQTNQTFAGRVVQVNGRRLSDIERLVEPANLTFGAVVKMKVYFHNF